MRLAELAHTSIQVAATASRRDKTRLLAELVAAAPAAERGLVVLYAAGQLRQPKTGVGPALVRAAMAAEPAATPTLEVAEVDGALEALASLRGAGATKQRQAGLTALFARATAEEQRLLAGLLSGELRQGALESLVVDAVAAAAKLPAPAVRRAQMLAADLAAVTAVAFDEGEAGLAAFDLVLFRPVQPMLAATAVDVADALAQLGRAGFEWKMDGVRVQVHRRGAEVRVYSRTQNDVTAAVPEVVALVAAMPARELVLDGEVIALRADGSPHRFQDTMRRFGRSREGDSSPAQLPLSAFFFDCMLRDGRPLLEAPTEERIAALRAVCGAAEVMPRVVTEDPAVASAFLHDALSRGHEGVMAKDPQAPYAAGRRGASWLKIKHAHTLDLVVLAAEWGSGRRRGFLSNLHLGARDPETGGFVMLGKTFKGLTDEMLRTQTAALLARETHRDAVTVYVRPELVVEVTFNDVQTSPHYPGGMALRFARVERHRPDKRAADADTIATVRELHARGDRG